MSKMQIKEQTFSTFEKLVVEYQDKLVNFFYRFCGDIDLAFDLTQETFLRVYKGQKFFDKNRSIAPWIFKIARNLAIDELRKSKLRRHISLQNDFPYIDEVQKEILSGEMSIILQKALDKIPQRMKEILVLRYFGELSYEEISKTLDIPLGTVKNRIFRARALLKKELEQYGIYRRQKNEKGYRRELICTIHSTQLQQDQF